MSIRPDYLTLDNLLQKRLFRIPEYQRAYSWEKKQRKDLFSDIEKLQHYPNERHHFMATVVCLKTGEKEELGADEFDVFNIVDGQQRLTTLLVILKALAKKLNDGDEDEKAESKKLRELLVKTDERLILLQTNHDSSSIFRTYLKEGAVPTRDSIKTAAEKNLVDAFEDCEKWVSTWSRGPLSLLKTIKNRLDFVFYVLEDEGMVYSVFEVLNSRGLEVDWLDKCKSMLMGIAFDKFEQKARREQVDELHKSWKKIYRTIGLHKLPGHEILRFAATLRYREERSKIVSAEEAIEFFRQHCEAHPKEILDVTEEFHKIVKKLEKLNANSRLKAVTDIAHARLLAIAIMLDDSLSDPEKTDVLKCWETATFRIFGLCKKDSRSKVGEYTRLAQEIGANNLSKHEIIRKVESLADKSMVSNAIDELGGSDCYNDWANEDLLYFFYRYEEYLAQDAGATISQETWAQIWSSSPSTTIEHIHPQNHDGIEWKGKLGRGRGQDKHINRLGNLLILPPGVNSKAGKKSFKDKKQIYENHRHLKLMDEILQKDDWNKDTIIEREKKLLNWAKTVWA